MSRLSPFEVAGIDIQTYMSGAEILARGEFLRALVEPVGHPWLWLKGEPYARAADPLGAPIVPIVLLLLDYGPGNTLPTALLWLGLSIAIAAAWIGWLAGRGVAGPWLFVFSLVPNPMLYMLAIGTDIPFAAAVAAFFLCYFRDSWRGRDIALWLGLLILVILTRPNGAVVLVFVALDLLWRGASGEPRRWPALVIVATLGLAAAFYYFDWFMWFLETSASKSVDSLFGISGDRFRAGLFSGLPALLDLPLSWLLWLLAKLAYFCGLRPTFESASWSIVLVRSAPGLVLLPGLIYALLKAPIRERIFILLFLAPILPGLSQERYNLPIMPILFCYGALAFQRILEWARTTMSRPRLGNSSD